MSLFDVAGAVVGAVLPGEEDAGGPSLQVLEHEARKQWAYDYKTFLRDRGVAVGRNGSTTDVNARQKAKQAIPPGWYSGGYRAPKFSPEAAAAQWSGYDGPRTGANYNPAGSPLSSPAGAASFHGGAIPNPIWDTHNNIEEQNVGASPLAMLGIAAGVAAFAFSLGRWEVRKRASAPARIGG